ncbi:hypothetical protein [Streptomyces anulatus]|uniref:hypothetical protein n=1 Tax=Streptomyces anulatus TaxID=1892 RepID=UPI00366747F7
MLHPSEALSPEFQCLKDERVQPVRSSSVTAPIGPLALAYARTDSNTIGVLGRRCWRPRERNWALPT